MTHRLLIIDNFDSFTYNLLHYCETFPGIYCEVKRNDEVDARYADSFDSLLFSPGPGLPKEAGNMMSIIRSYHRSKKILGVCLGMQALGEFFGAELMNGEFPMHGRISQFNITDHSSTLFKGIPPSFKIGRYHSWMVNEKTLPVELIPTGYAEDGSLQSMRHVSFPIEAVQFHPESVLTEYGREMMKNWLEG
jgi:anthranilate synthase component 2